MFLTFQKRVILTFVLRHVPTVRAGPSLHILRLIPLVKVHLKKVKERFVEAPWSL